MKWVRWQLVRLRWSKIGQYLNPPSYPTIGEWFGGQSYSFDPDRKRKWDK